MLFSHNIPRVMWKCASRNILFILQIKISTDFVSVIAPFRINLILAEFSSPTSKTPVQRSDKK